MEIRSFQADRVRAPRGTLAPFDPPANRPLDVEIGCGAGLHPIRYAQVHPERFLVAIEHTKTRFQLFKNRLDHHPELRAAGNLLAVHADAVAWVTHFLPRHSVDRYFLLYPNPYPKARDLNKRWHAMPFMGRLLETLKPGGTMTLATNLEFYATEAREYLTRHWGLVLESERELRAGVSPRTHFEKKYLARGEICRELVVRKI